MFQSAWLDLASRFKEASLVSIQPMDARTVFLVGENVNISRQFKILVLLRGTEVAEGTGLEPA